MTDLDLLESLLSCNTIDDLHFTTSKIIRQMGYEHFIYGVRVITSLAHPYQFIFSGYPKEWRSRYIEAGYEEIDPTVHHCIKNKSVIPIIWNDHLFKTQRLAQLMDEAKQFGLANGVSLAVHGGRGESAMLSMSTSYSSAKAKQIIIKNLGKAQLLACYLHEAVQRIVLTKEAFPLAQVELTNREKECLLWAAEGKTSWEIAHIIGTSERTVIFHLQNVSRKMGVSSRQHAIARAISMGLVTI